LSQVSNSERTEPGKQPPPIAFLLSRYPAISHTFFLKEVLGLRARGLEIDVASINPPDRALEKLPEVEASEARRTFYIKSGGRFSLALTLLSTVLRHPAAAVRGLGAALALGGWDLKARAFALFYLAEALLVGQWMRRRGLSHLHVHFGGPVATVGMLTARAWQIPWSITLHGPDEFFDQEQFYLRQKIESAQFIICISDFCRSQVTRIAPGLPASGAEVVRLGVDCSALLPRTHSTDETGVVRIVCTGRMVAAKGHRILLEALAAAAQPLAAKGMRVACVLIGDGPERPALETLSHRLGMGDSIRFAGAQAHGETLAQVAEADIFVLASFAEGLPVALMEAMALGVPCISTMIAAIPELIHNRDNSLLVPASNVEALSAAVIELAADPVLRHSLGRRARKTVEESYDLPTNLDKLADLWRRRLMG
jgi:colanic acid/amylovoran biosynthesis glycosyltransferase